MGGSSPPSAPDPYAVAGAQQQLNTNTLEEGQAASQVGQVNPTGSQMYYETGIGPGGVPEYTQVNTLSPNEQNLLGQFQGGQAAAGAGGLGLMDSAAAMYGAGVPNMTQGANSVTNQLMGSELGYLEPFFNTQNQQLQTQLLNQGIDQNSPAYQQAMNNQMQTQGQTVSGFLAQAQPQAFNEAMANYTMPAQLAGTLLGIGAPQAMPFGQNPQQPIQPANLIGSVGQSVAAQEQAYQAQLAQQNAMMSGLGSLGSAGILAMALAA